MMNKYPFFKRIAYSFFSKELYVFVGRSEINKAGIKYLLLLLCVFWIPEMVITQISITNSIKNELPLFVDKLPTIEITNGIAAIDKPSPYVITDEKTGKDLMIFDTSGEITSLEGTEAKLLLTDTKLIYLKNDFETREYSLATINDFTLTHEKIISWAGWGNYISILFYIFIIPFAFMYRAFLALIYTLIGLIFQAILGTKLSFQTIFRLCIVAMTPAFVIDKLLGYVDIDFTGWSFLCMVISLAYLFFAINCNKQAEQLPPPELGTDNSGGNSGI